ncbi:hypothetical protein OG21DRAFT_814870 [Imleria badia]|nr:hypothetical protein OG21DRAFT_814870 [Imleria badia]
MRDIPEPRHETLPLLSPPDPYTRRVKSRKQPSPPPHQHPGSRQSRPDDLANPACTRLSQMWRTMTYAFCFACFSDPSEASQYHAVPLGVSAISRNCAAKTHYYCSRK